MTPWLQQAIDAHSAGQVDTALDIVYDTIDDALLAGRFDEVNALFTDPSVQSLPFNLLFAVLTTTRRAHSRLPARPQLFPAARALIAALPEDERPTLLQWMSNLGDTP